MRKGGGAFKPVFAGMMAFTFAPYLLAAQDPFLTLDTVVQTNGQLQFNLNGENSVSYVIEGSSDLLNWTPLLVDSGPAATRTVAVDGSQNYGFYRASRAPLPFFAAAITARSNVTFNGNNISTDSYDSSDTNDFPGGLYNPAHRMDHGDVAVGNSSFISIGNGKIMGKVRIIKSGTQGDVALGPAGSVGSVSWVTGGGMGFEGGPGSPYFANDFRYCLPDVPVPYTSGLPLPPKVTNTYVLSSGQYFYNGNFSGNFVVTGQASLYVTGTFTGSEITIQSNASLTLLVGGASATLPIINTAGNTLSFQYYGLSGNTNVTLAGNVSYLGTIYAPEAALVVHTGGNNTVDFSGALVANSFNLNGNVNIHYDANLARVGPQR